MSAAQELGERGLEVVVLERRRAAGGKARSIDVTKDQLGAFPAPAQVRRRKAPWVPGEHGFRFFPGFYKHVIDSMSRIPTGPGGSVSDNLVGASSFGITQYGRQPMFQFPSRFPRTLDDARGWVYGLLEYFSPVTGLHLEDLAYFAGKLWQILTSCQERRLAEYEKIPWWTFVGADSQSDAYRKFGAQGITRSVVAARAESANTRTIGNTFIQMVLTLLDPSAPSDDRVLNGPTNEAWIDPWGRWLSDLGVEYRTHTLVKQLQCGQHGMTGVLTEHDGRPELVEGDYFVCALPIERIAPLVSVEMLKLDPGLEGLHDLAGNVEWMSGLQLYLRRDIPMLHGHVIHIDTEWALTSISQPQFWRPGTLSRYGDGEVNGIISIDISNWESPGLHGRPAIECSRQQVFDEVWAQLLRSLNSHGVSVLGDEDLCGWFLDPDIRPDPSSPGRLTNIEPLLVNLADTWHLRPDATTSIPNLFLASDYVRTYTDLATMEGANEAARRAVNGILDASGHRGRPCELWPLQEPAVFEPLRVYDATRFRDGLPWDPILLDLVSTAVPAIGPPFDRFTDAIAGLAGLGGQGPEPAPATSLLSGLRRAYPDLQSANAAAEQSTATPDPRLTDPVSYLSRRPVPATTVDSGPTQFDSRMKWYRDQTYAVIRGQLPMKEPRRDLYDLIRTFLDRPSKGLRPALCLATCLAYGGQADKAIWVAAGLEMLHGAFLVHDDIEDDSELRGGKPALHRRVGVPLAVNVGDGMNALSMRLFRHNVTDLDPEIAVRIFEEIDHLLIESLEGQALELGWVKENNCTVGVDDYLRLVLKKTGWYSFIHPVRIGALIAPSTDTNLDRFNRFGYLLAAAFQIQDDVLNLTGTPSRYGKEIGGDLWEGKRTLVLAHAFGHAPPTQRVKLESFFYRPRRARLPRQVAEIYDLLGDLGSIDWARRSAMELAAAAEDELPRAYAGAREGADLGFIRSLVRYVVEREV